MQNREWWLTVESTPNLAGEREEEEASATALCFGLVYILLLIEDFWTWDLLILQQCKSSPHSIETRLWVLHFVPRLWEWYVRPYCLGY